MRTLVNIRSTELWSISCSGFKTCIKSKQNCQLMNCFVQTLFIRGYELLCLPVLIHHLTGSIATVLPGSIIFYISTMLHSTHCLNLLKNSKDLFLPTLNNLKLASWYIFGKLIYTCKIRFLAGSNLQVRIKPDIFPSSNQTISC